MAKDEERILGGTDGKRCGWYCRGEQAETVGRTEISGLDQFFQASRLVHMYIHELFSPLPAHVAVLTNLSRSLVFQFQIVDALDTNLSSSNSPNISETSRFGTDVTDAHRIWEVKNGCVEMMLLEMNWGPSNAPHPTSTLGPPLVMKRQPQGRRDLPCLPGKHGR